VTVTVAVYVGSWYHTSCKYIQHTPHRTSLWKPTVTCRGRSVSCGRTWATLKVCTACSYITS